MDELTVFIVSACICGLVVVIILRISIAHIKLYKIHNDISSSIKCFTYLANTLALIASSCLFGLICNWYINKMPIGSAVYWTIVVISRFTSTFGLQISSYIIYLVRLKTTFKGSVHEISNCTFSIFLILFASYGIASGWVDYHLSLLSTISVAPHTKAEDIQGFEVIGHALLLSTGFVIYSSLLILFCSKLFKIIVLMKSTISMIHCYQEQNESLETDILLTKSKHFLNNRQENLLYLVTRTTILVTISIISSITLSLLFSSFYWTGPLPSDNEAITIRTLQCVYC